MTTFPLEVQHMLSSCLGLPSARHWAKPALPEPCLSSPPTEATNVTGIGLYHSMSPHREHTADTVNLGDLRWWRRKSGRNRWDYCQGLSLTRANAIPFKIPFLVMGTKYFLRTLPISRGRRERGELSHGEYLFGFVFLIYEKSVLKSFWLKEGTDEGWLGWSGEVITRWPLLPAAFCHCP